ncbi:MAG: hypothetical protein GYB19_10115 [Rhodospirillales bacterium]|nr:hypothetical protein [Rhodospirillales bacterium]
MATLHQVTHAAAEVVKSKDNIVDGGIAMTAATAGQFTGQMILLWGGVLLLLIRLFIAFLDVRARLGGKVDD